MSKNNDLTEIKFTPGPWKSAATRVVTEAGAMWRRVYSADGLLVASVAHDPSAGLIAASPELAACLEEILEQGLVPAGPIRERAWAALESAGVVS